MPTLPAVTKSSSTAIATLLAAFLGEQNMASAIGFHDYDSRCVPLSPPRSDSTIHRVRLSW